MEVSKDEVAGPTGVQGLVLMRERKVGMASKQLLTRYHLVHSG
jgi:hypothetical protein